jgi:hypothetical protein
MAIAAGLSVARVEVTDEVGEGVWVCQDDSHERLFFSIMPLSFLILTEYTDSGSLNNREEVAFNLFLCFSSQSCVGQSRKIVHEKGVRFLQSDQPSRWAVLADDDVFVW